MCLSHKWRVTERSVQPSPFKQMMEAKPVKVQHLEQDMFVNPVIVTYTCAKCGAQKVERV